MSVFPSSNIVDHTDKVTSSGLVLLLIRNVDIDLWYMQYRDNSLFA